MRTWRGLRAAVCGLRFAGYELSEVWEVWEVRRWSRPARNVSYVGMLSRIATGSLLRWMRMASPVSSACSMMSLVSWRSSVTLVICCAPYVECMVDVGIYGSGIGMG